MTDTGARNTRLLGENWLKRQAGQRGRKLHVSRFYPADLSRARRPTWWFEFPESDFAEEGKCTSFLCQDESDPQQFHHLLVPNSFLQRVKSGLDFRVDRQMYSIYLSADDNDRFKELRGSGGTDFSAFLQRPV